MGDVKLLPCPICGNTAVEPRRFDGEWSLVCADNRHMCEVTGMDRSDVIAAWNDRPALTPAQQAAEEIVEALTTALAAEQTRLYLLPPSDDYETSVAKDGCSARIGKYRAALAKAGKP